MRRSLPMDQDLPRRRFGAHRAAALTVLALSLALPACGGSGGSDDGSGGSAGAASPKAVTLNDGLARPWSLAFLPDGRMLVTEKSGALLRLSADGRTVERRWTDLPAVQAAGQGGLLDVVVPPDYEDGGWIYWSYSEPGTGAEDGLAGTAVARARLRGDRLGTADVIFRQQPKVEGNQHFGSRLVFGRDGLLYVTLGERRQDDPAAPDDEHAQNVANDLGKVVRIRVDGSLPDDNPDFGTGARPELYSIGHRNPQGAALHPETGELWVVEHGPQGGDELNRVVPGGNYGWPLRSYGCPYGDPPGEACQVGGGRHRPDFVEPQTYWVPISIAPSGLAFVTGRRYAGWQGSVLTGALAGEALWRLELEGSRITARHKLYASLGERIRDVRQGPDGYVFLLTDSGKLMRLD